MKINSLLIIGRKPLPIGGVTIHVQRLIDWLEREKIEHEFYDLKTFSISSCCRAIHRSQYAHLHTSSPFFRLIFAILCCFYSSKSIITYHGNLGRYKPWLNLIDYLSVKISFLPIVINANSLVLARKYNKRSLLLSAYLPNVNDNLHLESDMIREIDALKNRCSFVFCTNAFDVSYDVHGEEIYSITQLTSFFSKHADWGLIISDPSGNYRRKIQTPPSNVIFLNRPHPFIRVIEKSDCFIRYTTTDGDSLSIHEALGHRIPVIATDVVDRPQGVYSVALYDFEALEHVMTALQENLHHAPMPEVCNTPDVVRLYQDILGKNRINYQQK